MSEIDEDWTTLHNLAKSRSRMFVSDPKLREFLQEALLPRHRDAYLRLLDVERMARGPVPRQDSDAMAPLDPSSLVGRWQEACETLRELEERFPERDALAAEICRDPRCHSDAFIWRLLDLGLPDVAEAVVLARLEAEGNPEGRKRNDYTTDLLAMCRAQSANGERVEGDACGAFEKLRRATCMLRPGGDPYVSGKVLSYFASACIALGRVELADGALERACGIFDRSGLVTEMAEVVINKTHSLLFQGEDPRAELEEFLRRHSNNLMIHPLTFSVAKMSLVSVLLYLHGGDGAAELLSTLPHFNPGSVEDLWKRHYTAIVTLRNGNPLEASRQFADTAHEFFAASQPSQGFFMLLFQALSLLDMSAHTEAHQVASKAATYFSSSRFYGGVARSAAEEVLAVSVSSSLSREAIETLIRRVVSPARKSSKQGS